MSDKQPPPEDTRPACDPSCEWDADPPGLSETARKRRAEILDAAEAITATDGIDELSLKKIEDRAGMSRGQLTYYFPTRESILLAVYERMIRRMIRSFLAGDGPKPMTGRAWDCVRFVLGKHLEPGSEDRGKELFTLLFTFLARMNQRTEYREKLSEMYRGWRGRVAADVADSVPEPRPVDPRTAASIFQALVLGLDVQLMIDPAAFDRAAMLDACTRLLGPVFTQGPVSSGFTVSDACGAGSK